jgi:hypothetical protein
VPGDSGRMYLCGRCRGRAVICRSCDRGNLYCSRSCSDGARREKQKEARGRYQQSREGRSRHAQAQQRYRDRKKQKVTYQGLQGVAEDGQKVVVEERPSAKEAAKEKRDEAATDPKPPGDKDAEGEVAQDEKVPMYRCTMCGRRCSVFVRFWPLVQCHRPRRSSSG